MHEKRGICREFAVVGREKRYHCEEKEEEARREKRGFRTDETEGGIRDGALEDEADER